MRPLAVLRPEPGNAATRARIAAVGGTPIALPLFEVRALAWTPPAPARFDALFLTSANAVRHAGAALSMYRDLSVFAVGEATAGAARAAALRVTAVGTGDAADLAVLANSRGIGRALHLTGRDRAHEHLPGIADTIAVYASDFCDLSGAKRAILSGCVALIHSPRAGARLAVMAPDRSAIRIAAISDAALAAAGSGWAATAVATRPDDDALIAAGLTLAD